MTDTRPLLEVTDLVKHYPMRNGMHRTDRAAQHAAPHRIVLDEIGHLEERAGIGHGRPVSSAARQQAPR